MKLTLWVRMWSLMTHKYEGHYLKLHGIFGNENDMYSRL